MQTEQNMDVIVLAGDRGPNDPLAMTSGVSGKTLVPVAGVAMLTRVLRSLADWPGLGRIVLVVPNGPDYQQAVAAAGPVSSAVETVTPADSPSLSVAKALQCLGRRRPVVLTTADHPLLKPEWLDRLCQGRPDHPVDDDLRVGLVDWSAVMQAFPDSRRTRYRFRNQSVCGTNLFLFNSTRADQVLERWRSVEQNRKRPWKVVSLLGWVTLARYLRGALTLDQGFESLSRRLGLTISPVLLDDPECAVDVDSAVDLALVEQAIAGRAS